MTNDTDTVAATGQPVRRLLFIGGIALVAGAVLDFLGVLGEAGPLSSVTAFLVPLVLASAAAVLAFGNVGGRSVLARIGLLAYAAGFLILIGALVAVMAGSPLELLFPLGGTLLTLGMLVAGIEVARVGAVGGFARWGLLAVGVWMLLGDVVTFAGWDLGAFADANGPGVVAGIVQTLLLVAEGVALAAASRHADG